MISFTVPGQPVAKGRPRMGNGRVYTPAKTVAYEALVNLCARNAMARAGRRLPAPGPIQLTVYFFMRLPKTSRRQDPTVKPDLDNLLKIVMDAMNSLVWLDDAQIINIAAGKCYGDPRVEIEVTEL